ncbi:MAG: hypothetical protein KatS3mg076_0312 [Candidatus Binatia bacterium]|nr:MAG: hypothetical protein KatS3mg076_0312 [Candidatus Binatia bacterium]
MTPLAARAKLVRETARPVRHLTLRRIRNLWHARLETKVAEGE